MLTLRSGFNCSSSQSSWQSSDQNDVLKDALGFSPPTVHVPLKKGALKKAAGKADSSGSLDGPCVWKNLYKVITKKEPLRAYIQGSSSDDVKKRLIVEVTQKQSPDYLAIIDKIYEKLKTDNISKAQALAMRADLCNS